MPVRVASSTKFKKKRDTAGSDSPRSVVTDAGSFVISDRDWKMDPDTARMRKLLMLCTHRHNHTTRNHM